MARSEGQYIADALVLDGAGGAMPGAAKLSGLTRRELEGIRLVARGQTNQGIAEELGVSAHTVKRHLANVFARADVRSRAAAAVLAERHFGR